jgi:phage terminase large subunit-like protein
LFDRYVYDVHKKRGIYSTRVEQAVARHLRDLVDGAARGLVFDRDEAGRAIRFFDNCTHSKGLWAGQRFVLSDWQAFAVGCLFGWQRTTGGRRFRRSYLQVARKNGKTTLAAGVGLYGLIADREQGAEVYSAATKAEQAKLIWSEACEMVKRSPKLARFLDINNGRVVMESTASFFGYIGSNHKRLDGLNPHIGLADELHQHPTRDVYDVLQTGMGARHQPLMFSITTAGHDRQSFCYSEYDIARNILDRTIDDDAFFVLIFELDEGDDWENESVYIKANPNLGVSVYADSLIEGRDKAKAQPTFESTFRRLRLNEWTDSAVRWIRANDWQACAAPFDLADFEHVPAWAALDLASNTDLATMAIVWPIDSTVERDATDPAAADLPPAISTTYFVHWLVWIPEDNMRQRVEHDRVHYDVWQRQGHLTATPGNVIDYGVIQRDIFAAFERFNIRCVGYDRWGATQLVQQLESENLSTAPVGQGFKTMTAPMREIDAAVVGERLRHNANPIAQWCAANTVATKDPADNIKPDKNKSSEKIDLIVALAMAIDLTLRRVESDKKPNATIYDGRGFMSF